MRSVSLFAAAAWLAACSGDPSQSGLIYYPLFVGSRWTYEMSGHKELDGKIFETRAARHERVGLTDCTVIEASLDGKQVSTEHLSATKQGIFRHSFDNERLPTPVCLMKFPYKPGATWEDYFNIRELGRVKIVVEASDEDLVLPYGTIRALRSTMRVYSGSREVMSTIYWFGKGIGMVKQTIKIGGLEVAVNLRTFSIAMAN